MGYVMLWTLAYGANKSSPSPFFGAKMSQAADILPQSPSAGFKSVPDLWHHRVESLPDGDAMYYREGNDWVTMSWRDAGIRTHNIANGLLSLGVSPKNVAVFWLKPVLSGFWQTWVSSAPEAQRPRFIRPVR